MSGPGAFLRMSKGKPCVHRRSLPSCAGPAMNRRPSLRSSIHRTTRWFLTATLMVVASCLGGDRMLPTEPGTMAGEPQFLISDGAHPGGMAGFYFLPPMVSNPTFSGSFDYDIAAINPVVAICEV